MLWDSHMHTHFSGDSEADSSAMARAAVAKNLSGICITDHLDYDYPDDPDLFIIDFDQYSKEIHKLQSDFSDVLTINYGIELGLQPHLAKKHHALLQTEDFDFVIGSSHVVHGIDRIYLFIMKAARRLLLTGNILNQFWKILLHLMNLMYTDTLIMWYVTVQIKMQTILIKNSKM